MLGLDNAGKTTLLYKLKLGERVDAIPTIGFNVESVQFRNVNFTVWDVGGQDKTRPLWKYYFHSAQELIFVVDSNHRERLAEARDELQRLLGEDELRDAKVLVFANKQDLPQAVTMSEMTEKLGLATEEPSNGTCRGVVAPLVKACTKASIGWPTPSATSPDLGPISFICTSPALTAGRYPCRFNCILI